MTNQYAFYDKMGYPTKLESEFINDREVASRATRYIEMGGHFQKWDVSVAVTK